MLDLLHEAPYLFFGCRYILAESKIVCYGAKIPSEIPVIIYAANNMFCYLFLPVVQIKHAELVKQQLVEGSFYFKREGLFFIYFRIIVVFKLIICNIVFVAYIFADVNIIIFILAAIILKLFIICPRIIKIFIIHFPFLMCFFCCFQGGVFFHLLFDPFFKIGRRHLQQFHELNLLWRQFL